MQTVQQLGHNQHLQQQQQQQGELSCKQQQNSHGHRTQHVHCVAHSRRWRSCVQLEACPFLQSVHIAST
jgi:hypothetical protein